MRSFPLPLRPDRLPLAAAILAVVALLGTGQKALALRPIPALVIAAASLALAATAFVRRDGEPVWRSLALGVAVVAVAAAGLTMLVVAPCGHACW